jgi:ribonuclease BN (tRNA processing enzyme)
MKLTVLGSGTTVPHPRRSSSAYWLETSQGTILLDCSAPAIYRATQEDLIWWELDAIWISHFHMDHVGGLAPFLAGTKHAPQMKHREKPLRIFGGPGLKKLLEDFNDANNYKLFEQPFPLDVVEIGDLDEFEILPGVGAIAFPTPHTPESRALRVADEGKILVYTADTGYSLELAAFAREADLLVIESSYPGDKTQEKHLELKEAMEIIRLAAAKRAVLTHLYQVWDEVDGEAEIAKFGPECEVILAYDGLRVDI